MVENSNPHSQNMINLPIINSILNGELRPGIIMDVMDMEELNNRRQKLRSHDASPIRSEIEFMLSNALEGIVPVGKEYQYFTHKVQRVKDARQLFMTDDTQEQYTPLSEGVYIDSLFDTPKPQTAVLRLYQRLTELECRRTLWAVHETHLSYGCDSDTRCELDKLFDRIVSLCQQAHRDLTKHAEAQQLVLQALVKLYFSLMINYREVKNDAKCDVEDFEDMVYDIWGEYPSEEQTNVFALHSKPKLHTPNVDPTTQTESANAKEKPKSKAEWALERLEPLGFLSVTKIQNLNSRNKVLKLLEVILENPGHTSAMLDYIKLYKHITDNHLHTNPKYTLNQYDKDIGSIFDLSANGFRNYRTNNTMVKNKGAKYYKKQCEIEYYNILHS